MGGLFFNTISRINELEYIHFPVPMYGIKVGIRAIGTDALVKLYIEFRIEMKYGQNAGNRSNSVAERKLFNSK